MRSTGAVLVDTGAWLAAFHRRDQYHFRAAAELRRLRESRARLIVTDLILAETHLHLLYALGPSRALGYLETLKTDPNIDEVHATPVLQRAAIGEWMSRFTDQAFTLTDAISFAAMRSRRIDTAFTFDRHFRIAGFRVIPESGNE